VTFDDTVIHAVFEANHEMRSDLDHCGQEIEREVAAIKQIGPAGAKLQRHRRLQVMNLAGGGENKLIRHASHPVQDAGHFGGAGLLPITRPIEGGQREFDQTGVNGGNVRKLLAHLLKARAVMTEQEHPGLDHLLQVTLRKCVRQSIARHRSTQCGLGIERILNGVYQPSCGRGGE
jgi:hypothetical protein